MRANEDTHHLMIAFPASRACSYHDLMGVLNIFLNIYLGHVNESCADSLRTYLLAREIRLLENRE